MTTIREIWRGRMWERLVETPDEGVLSRDADGLITWSAAGGGGVTDHGALTGLGDNDHPQYVLASTITAAGAALIDDASAAAQRITLNDAAAALAIASIRI